MAPIDEAKLPSVDEAKVLQKQHAAAKREALADRRKGEQIEAHSVSKSNASPDETPKPEEKVVEASKFLQSPEHPEAAGIPPPPTEPPSWRPAPRNSPPARQKRSRSGRNGTPRSCASASTNSMFIPPARPRILMRCSSRNKTG